MRKARNRNERCTDRRGGGVLVSCSLSWAASAGPLLLQRPGRAVERGGRRKGRVGGELGGWETGGARAGELGGCVQVSWAEKRQARALQALQGLHPLVPPKVPGALSDFFFSSEKRKKKFCQTALPFSL